MEGTPLHACMGRPPGSASWQKDHRLTQRVMGAEDWVHALDDGVACALPPYHSRSGQVRVSPRFEMFQVFDGTPNHGRHTKKDVYARAVLPSRLHIKLYKFAH